MQERSFRKVLIFAALMRIFRDFNDLPPFRGTVLTIGSFDGVHTGHRRILEQVCALARESGGESVVITFDPHPRTVLKPDDTTFKLITTTAEKMILLAQCGIDNVVIVPFSAEFARLTAQEYVQDFLVGQLHPQHVVIGYDHRFGANREGNLAFLKEQAPVFGFEITEIPAHEVDEIAVSSSKIRRALEVSDLPLANRLLGHPFFFSGTVVAGNRIGRTIGFPTANIAISDPHKFILPQGIYAAQVKLPSQEIHPAMLYIGNRPTIEGDDHQVIEVNILDFDGDLYGQDLTVDVLDFIRPDKKLDGLEALKAQIEADKQEIVQRFSSLPPPAIAESISMQHTASRAESVAIVILNYNTRKHLETYLPSVVAHSAGARIIVADNGSPDDSVAFLRAHYPAIEVIEITDNQGFAAGYNTALQGVDADVYVILNSDVEVTPGWMEPVLLAMQQDPTIAIAQPKILSWTGKTRFEHAGAAGGWMDTLGYPFCRGRIFNHVEEDRGQYDTPQDCFWAAGAAFFIRAKLYHAFGGFDGDYFAHNEEIDLCWRLKRAGYAVWCIPQSVVYHLGGGTLGYDSPRKVFLNFRNSLYTLLKNERTARLFLLIPARLLLDGVAALLFVSKGQFAAISAILRSHFSFYGNFGKTLTKRRAVAQIIDSQRIGPENKAGVYNGSVVWRHYVGRIKEFVGLVDK